MNFLACQSSLLLTFQSSLVFKSDPVCFIITDSPVYLPVSPYSNLLRMFFTLLRLYTLTILLRECCLTAGYRLTKYNSIHYSTRTDPRLAPTHITIIIALVQ